MKLFISADIEGCAGVALTDETHKKESVYQRFAEEMTEEVVAACEAAHEAGADEIVVKDGHGDASNIDPLKMPEYVTLIRGKSGHPYNMMYGIDDSYDAKEAEQVRGQQHFVALSTLQPLTCSASFASVWKSPPFHLGSDTKSSQKKLALPLDEC